MNNPPSSNSKKTYYICQACCSHIDLDDIGEANHKLHCSRCGHGNKALKKNSPLITLSFSLAALFLFIPANFYPFMTMELYGQTNSSTIWGGVKSLMTDGSYFIAIVVFLASLVIPVLKLIILLYLALTARNGRNPRFKTKLYFFLEAIGRWSMLDIFLLAVFVAIIKIRHWTQVTPELGSLLFLIVVLLTLFASNYFDPRILWDKENSSEKESY